MKKQNVIKHSCSIHITNKITILQKKIWNVLLANAFDDLPLKNKYSIPVKELLNYIDYHNDLDAIKQALTGLGEIIIEWNIFRQDKKCDWGFTTMLPQANIEDGICYYEYTSFLREQLYNPRMYAKINIKLQNLFKSKHSLSIYELAADFKKLPNTQWFKLSEFKKYLGLKENDYDRFSDFNHCILKKAKKDIDEFSDLSIEFKFKRQCRKISHIQIKIKQNVNKFFKNKPALNKEDSQQYEELLHILVNEFYLSHKVASGLIQTCSHDINPNIQYIRFKISQGNVKNIKAYATSAIKNNYRHNSDEQSEPTVRSMEEIIENQRMLEEEEREFNEGRDEDFDPKELQSSKELKETLKKRRKEKEIKDDLFDNEDEPEF